MAREFVIASSVVDLREQPLDLGSKDYSRNNLRNTQLLFGEKISILEDQGAWLKIAALEQAHYKDEKGWHFYEGWIKKEECQEVIACQSHNLVVGVPSATLEPQNIELSFGTYLFGDKEGNIFLPNGEKGYCHPKNLRPIVSKICPTQLIQDAKLFLKLPYLWGGKAFQTKSVISSVDCSGLIYLIFRAQGKTIPRDAHPQHLKGKEIEKLEMGDLLYLSKGAKVSHVILKCEGPYFLDSSESEGQVRFLRWGEDIWERDGKFYIKDPKIAYTPFFRSFL